MPAKLWFTKLAQHLKWRHQNKVLYTCRDSRKTIAKLKRFSFNLTILNQKWRLMNLPWCPYVARSACQLWTWFTKSSLCYLWPNIDVTVFLLLTWNIILQVTLVLTFDVFSFTTNVTKLAATKQTAIEMNMTITNVLGFLEALFVCMKIQIIDENKTLTLTPSRQLYSLYKNDLYD